MAKHSDEAADRALIRSMVPGAGSASGVVVNPAGTNQNNVTNAIIGEVPLARTMQKPQAYKQTKGAP